MRNLRYLLFIIFFLGAHAFAGAEEIGEKTLRLGQGKIGFWIGTGQNTIFDEQVISLIAQHAGIVVLNTPLVGYTPEHNYNAIVQRLHKLEPKLPVLLYTWASRWHDTKQVGTATLKGYPDTGFLLRDRKGDIITRRQGKSLYGDVRKEEYRHWLINKIKNMLRKTETGGVALDVVLRTPSTVLSSLCKHKSNFCKSYAEGIDALLGELHEEIKPKVVLFNGLWSLREGMLKDQQKLLSFTDGAAIEFFGFHHRRGAPSFQEGILPYLSIIQKNLDKYLLFFGRGSWSYQDYEKDYLWQRYLYCSYLLAAGPNTLFKYHATFQAPSGRGRSGGLDIYGDWLIDLGSAIAPYEKQKGLYLRHFTKGLVLVAPHEGSQAKYSLPAPMFSPEGKEFKGTITIESGHGMLLLKRKPPKITSNKKDFENSSVFGNGWISKNIKIGKNNNQFLHLEKIATKGEKWKHDLLLDPIRTLQPMPRLVFRLRTEDKKAKFLLVAEVDDKKKQYDRVVIANELVASVGGSAFTNTNNSNLVGENIYFRAPKPSVKVPYIPLKISIIPDGEWHTILINGKLIEVSGRYTFRRWVFVRPIGSIDIDDISLKESL